MLAPNPYVILSTDPTKDDALTEAGKAAVRDFWRTHFVFDDVEIVGIDDVHELVCADPRFAGTSPASSEIVAEILAVGACPDRDTDEEGGPSFFKARVRDGLGAVFGEIRTPEIGWIFHDLILDSSVTLLVGGPGELKTWVELAMLAAAAHRRPFLGRKATLQNYLRRDVLALDYEMGADEVARRLHLLGDGEGRVGRVCHPPFGLADPRLYAELATKFAPTLVGVDSLSRGNPGVDENDARFAEPLGLMSRFAAEHGTSFVVLHHTPKNHHGRLADVVRGTSAIAPATDAVFFVEAVRDFETEDPSERRARLSCLRLRRGGVEPDPFVVRLTNGRGLELVREDEQEDDEARVLRVIEGNPGIAGSEEIAKLAGLAKARAVVARRALETSARIRNEGSAPRPRWFVAPSKRSSG